MHVTSTNLSHNVESGAHHLGANGCHVVSVVWVHHHIDAPTVVPARHLGIGNGVIVSGLGSNNCSETCSATLAQVEPQVIGERTVSIGTFGCHQ
jgi:hypothetical protein